MAFSKEQQLLLYCSRARTDTADLDRIKALCALPLDWQYVLDKNGHFKVPRFPEIIASIKADVKG